MEIKTRQAPIEPQSGTFPPYICPKYKIQQLWDSGISCLGATVHQTMVVILTTAYLTHIDSATMAAATGWTGKMSVQVTTMVTASSIRTTMRMESGSSSAKFTGGHLLLTDIL